MPLEEFNVKLTRTDRMVLESYKGLVEGLSHYLGDGYEIVLHSLEDCNHAAIKVINGYHTGRNEGAPITDLALSMLAQIRQQPEDCADITYFSKNKRGEPLKSTTITIRGEQGRIIGLLCINFYLNTAFSTILQNFTAPSESSEDDLRPETFSDNSDELVEQIVCQVREEVFANTAVPANCKHKEIVRILAERGLFNLKDSVPKAAKFLGISKNTVYLHLRSIK